MITELTIRKFRSYDDVTFRLEPLTLFIGPVAGGKSNVFEALTLLQNSVHSAPAELFSPGLSDFRWVRSLWARTTDSIELGVRLTNLPEFPGETARYELEIAEGPRAMYVARERLERYGGAVGENPGQLVFERTQRGGALGEFGRFEPEERTVLCSVHQARGPDSPTGDPALDFAWAVARTLSSYGYYHLSPGLVERPSDVPEADRIGYRGERVPAYLAKLRSDPGTQPLFSRIRDEMREILPGLEEILLTTTARGSLGVSLQFSRYQGFIAAPDLSDGTMLTLGLLCVVHQPELPRHLSLEEPETGLHPGRLKWLFERLVGLAYPPQGQEPVQVLVSTHSPYLLDFLKDRPSAVRVVEATNGRSQVTSLSEILGQLPAAEEDVPLGHQWYMGLFERR